MTGVDLRSAERAPELEEKVLTLIHEAGNPYYDWFFGGPERARAALSALYASGSSEVSSARTTVLLGEGRLLGAYVALPGEELARCRLADALLLLSRTEAAERDAFCRRLEAARGLFAEVPPGDYYLSKIGVAPEARGQGLGGALLDRVLHEGRERGFRRLRLDVPAANARAVALYRSRGLAVVRARAVEGLRYLEMAGNLAQP